MTGEKASDYILGKSPLPPSDLVPFITLIGKTPKNKHYYIKN